jgi:hypothetical protein
MTSLLTEIKDKRMHMRETLSENDGGTTTHRRISNGQSQRYEEDGLLFA